MKLEKHPIAFGKQKALFESIGLDFDEFIIKSQEEKAEILHSLQKEYLGTDKPVNHIKPLVSVCTITYRHVPFIREYFEGVLMQQTNFPFEIIVCDDGSDDGTAEICREYAQKHPDKIRLYDRIRPLARVYDKDMHFLKQYNFDWCLDDARGKYIALCEGDDYWTDPLKLQKQVDFLESHPECSMTFHKIRIHKEGRGASNDYVMADVHGREYSGNEIFESMLFQLASVVVKKEVFETVEYKRAVASKKFIGGDILVYMSAANYGKIWCIPDEMSVYRVHPGGITNVMRQDPFTFIKENELIPEYFGEKYRSSAKAKNIKGYLRTLIVGFKTRNGKIIVKSVRGLLKNIRYIKLQPLWIGIKRIILHK